ncbi:hypothetical protein ACTIVE_1238 [Actinomadura verrucosospora]|uniref:Uncharacterized protein n=1 Tax=Actinomadura verrucosospora TaxID=46165 RepID=A0A7D3ZJ91_ACTVE|nr:hypothetical protein ACTIVE_1238 [Actinomadura verrucosospora]
MPAHQRRLSRVRSTSRSHSPVETGASPNTTAVATAAPVRPTALKNDAWKIPVAADAAATGGHVRRDSDRNAPGSAASTSAARTTPPDRIRAPPTATGPAADPASTCAGPTVPHRTPAASTSRTLEGSFRRSMRPKLGRTAAVEALSRSSFGSGLTPRRFFG